MHECRHDSMKFWGHNLVTKEPQFKCQLCKKIFGIEEYKKMRNLLSADERRKASPLASLAKTVRDIFPGGEV